MILNRILIWNFDFLIQLIKFSRISFHSQLSMLLFCLCLIYASSGNFAFAKSGPGVEQAELQVPQVVQPDQTARTGDDTDSRELSGFFMIGMAINAVMMLSFAAWFIMEWKKQNKHRVRDKQK